MDIFVAVEAVVGLGVSLVQLREKNLSAQYLYELAVDLVSMTSGTETRLLINDRADIAVAAGADGVHLTSRSLPAKNVRKVFGDDLLIGVSTHSSDDVERAVLGGADFAVFGPIFETPGKNVSNGIIGLREICEEFAPFPVLGLGGIDETNFRSVIEAGASGFAAIRALNVLNDDAAVRRITAAMRSN